MPEVQPLYCAGKFITTEISREVLNPFDDSVISLVSVCDNPIYEEAVKAAIDARKPLGSLSNGDRSRKLALIAEAIQHREEEFTKTICLESGKPFQYARAETLRAVETFRIASEEALRPYKEYVSLDRTPSGKGREGLVKAFPAGVVAGITPFNFPLNLVSHKVAPALAAACPIIIKPASKTPLTCLLLADVIHQTGFPAGTFSVLPMDRKQGDKMVTDERFAVLSFTGSPEIGWDMKSRSGKKKVVLELGGNAGVLVAESAGLNHAVDRCVMGSFAYSGQVCIHAQRIFCDGKLFNSFQEKFLLTASNLRYGNPLDPATEISNMIDLANAERVENWVNLAVGEGAKILTGGKRAGSYYPPTVLTNTHSGMKVCSEEIFGPVVNLEPVENFRQGIDLLNDSRFGLQAGVFTENISEADIAFAELEVGGVILNDVPTLRFDEMPYGGVKDSGFGREGVKYAMLDMMELRILVK